jgi:hypothetical protein
MSKAWPLPSWRLGAEPGLAFHEPQRSPYERASCTAIGAIAGRLTAQIHLGVPMYLIAYEDVSVSSRGEN